MVLPTKKLVPTPHRPSSTISDHYSLEAMGLQIRMEISLKFQMTPKKKQSKSIRRAQLKNGRNSVRSSITLLLWLPMMERNTISDHFWVLMLSMAISMFLEASSSHTTSVWLTLVILTIFTTQGIGLLKLWRHPASTMFSLLRLQLVTIHNGVAFMKQWAKKILTSINMERLWLKVFKERMVFKMESLDLLSISSLMELLSTEQIKGTLLLDHSNPSFLTTFKVTMAALQPISDQSCAPILQ